MEHLKRFFQCVEERGWVYTLPKGAGEGEVKKEEEEEVKEEEGKKLRKGGGALALGGPLAVDVMWSII